MRRPSRPVVSFSVLLPLLAGLPAVVPSVTQAAVAQPAAGEAQAQSQLRDFIHFVRIARFDIAADVGRQLLDSGMEPEDFVDLVDRSREGTRFEEAIASAMRVPIVEPIAAELDQLFRAGKLARVRNPEEITRNIGLLTGGLRARQIGREGLIAAGEYALPQLLEAYLQNRDPNLRAQVQRVLVDLGRQSIVPLVTALPDLDPARQEAIVDVLGLIPYRTSLPFLVDLHQNTRNEAVRRASARAIGRLGGNANADVAGLYALLANSYYAEPGELTSFANEEHQLLWHFDPGLGLVMTPIRTEVFHEAMAMRMAETALAIDATNRETLALWIASNFSRELDTPEGYENPAYPPDRRGAMYFGVAAGPEIGQLVLRRALDTRNTPLARLSIDTIAQTAGPRLLWGQGVDDRFPLLEALAYPNRRVQYEAALAIGKSRPEQSFRSSERVVPLLAGAVRDAGTLTAIILTGRDREMYEADRSVLEAMGFRVLPPSETGLDGIEAAIAEAPAVDLIVTRLGFDQTLLEIETARSSSKLAVTPVLAIMSAEEEEALRRQYRRDQTVAVRRALGPSEFTATAEELLRVASGGVITEEEARSYGSRALAVLRDLAVSNNPVLDVAEAASILMPVLRDADGLTMLDVAEILAHVGSPAAQRAIFERALTADGFEQIEMLEIVADSAKRFGNQLDARLVRRLVELARSGDEDLATQAVAVMGAMEIENEELVPLILSAQPGSAPTVSNR
ncbi:MAG: HEAT repeat domain-containing protein [Phycisphaerales bacterium]|nr:HEAT repeat domain-containing protein [Planctomycetota bacterium]MCH8508204.1 HEAT repeat domain-containing protein [Phycisphaerales bacterium]